MKNFIYKLFLLSLFINWATAQTTDELVTLHTVSNTTNMGTITGMSDGSLVFNLENGSLYAYYNGTWYIQKSIGSSTSITAGSNVTVTGTGTTGNPYVINAVKGTLTNNNNGTYTFTNGTDTVTFTQYDINGLKPIIQTIENIKKSTTRNIVIKGLNFTPNTTLSIANSNITLNSYVIDNNYQITANITATAVTGSYPITFSNPAGTSTANIAVDDLKIYKIDKYEMVLDYDLNETLVYENNFLTKLVDSNQDSQAVTNRLFIPAGQEGYLQFTVRSLAKRAFLGLSTDYMNSKNHDTIDYAIETSANGYIYIYENNSYTSYNILYYIGDVFKIHKASNGTVRYYRNDVLLRTSPTLATGNLHFDSSLQDPGASFTDIIIAY